MFWAQDSTTEGSTKQQRTDRQAPAAQLTSVTSSSVWLTAVGACCCLQLRSALQPAPRQSHGASATDSCMLRPVLSQQWYELGRRTTKVPGSCTILQHSNSRRQQKTP